MFKLHRRKFHKFNKHISHHVIFKGEKERLKNYLAFLLIVLLIPLTVPITIQVNASIAETPLEVAEKAACYVISQAIAEYGGYKWLYYDPTGAWERPGMHSVAGIGTFLATLYEITGNTTYLDYAEGAARWLISKAVPERGGYKWPYPDRDIPSPGWWLSPVVREVGEFFLQMYRLTENLTYLNYAKGAAQWMVAMAEPEAGGYFIPYNPPGKYGSQAAHGIMPGREACTATFLLHMWEETGNETYLFYAKEVAEWLITGPDIRIENGGYTWQHDRPYWVSPRYHVHGTGRIALFFYELYEALGNETYLHYANGAIQWILSKAVFEDTDKVKWPAHEGSTCYPLTIGWLLWDVITAADVLLVGYSITTNSTYLEYAIKHANWIISQAIQEPTGYVWINALGTAFIYKFLMEMYQYVPDQLFLEYAEGGFQWIINNATIANGCWKWKTVPYYPYYPWWLMHGAAGIGYHLLIAPIPAYYIEAMVDIDPNTLNLKSRGRWITAYIELPESYNVSDIDVSTIMLNDTIPAEPRPVAIGDYDNDSVPDLMVKFDRSAVISCILDNVNMTKLYLERFMIITLTITGKLKDGTQFQGSDAIRITMPRPRGRHIFPI